MGIILERDAPPEVIATEPPGESVENHVCLKYGWSTFVLTLIGLGSGLTDFLTVLWFHPQREVLLVRFQTVQAVPSALLPFAALLFQPDGHW